MENRICTKCCKKELYDTDLLLGDKPLFLAGDKQREIYNIEQATEAFGVGAVRVVWNDKVSDTDVFCRECILEICQKHKSGRKKKVAQS